MGQYRVNDNPYGKDPYGKDLTTHHSLEQVRTKQGRVTIKDID